MKRPTIACSTRFEGHNYLTAARVRTIFCHGCSCGHDQRAQPLKHVRSHFLRKAMAPYITPLGHHGHCAVPAGVLAIPPPLLPSFTPAFPSPPSPSKPTFASCFCFVVPLSCALAPHSALCPPFSHSSLGHSRRGLFRRRTDLCGLTSLSQVCPCGESCTGLGVEPAACPAPWLPW